MKNYKYEINGIALTDYCKEAGISYNTVYGKILDGLSIEDAIKHAQKVKNNRRHYKNYMDGTTIINYFETNYKHPVTAYLRYCKLKYEGHNHAEIMNKLEKYKE